jgi:hypothetical protein
MIVSLKEMLQRTVQLQELTQVASRIEKKAKLLEGMRTFIKEG